MVTDKWYQPFCITSVCRGDLEGILTESDITRMDDDDMREIAEKMADAYCESAFWTDLEIIAKYVLGEKAKQ